LYRFIHIDILLLFLLVEIGLLILFGSYYFRYSKDIRAFAVFKTILINETYLSGLKSLCDLISFDIPVVVVVVVFFFAHYLSPLTSKTILIDSPGFVAEKDILNNIEEMSCNLNIYQGENEC
jgi:hypothetical protein